MMNEIPTTFYKSFVFIRGPNGSWLLALKLAAAVSGRCRDFAGHAKPWRSSWSLLDVVGYGPHSCLNLPIARHVAFWRLNTSVYVLVGFEQASITL